MIRHITEDLEIPFDESDEFDEEYFYFNRRLKKFYKHKKYALHKLFFSLDCPYTVNYVTATGLEPTTT